MGDKKQSHVYSIIVIASLCVIGAFAFQPKWISDIYDFLGFESQQQVGAIVPENETENDYGTSIHETPIYENSGEKYGSVHVSNIPENRPDSYPFYQPESETKDMGEGFADYYTQFPVNREPNGMTIIDPNINVDESVSINEYLDPEIARNYSTAPENDPLDGFDDFYTDYFSEKQQQNSVPPTVIEPGIFHASNSPIASSAAQVQNINNGQILMTGYPGTPAERPLYPERKPENRPSLIAGNIPAPLPPGQQSDFDSYNGNYHEPVNANNFGSNSFSPENSWWADQQRLDGLTPDSPYVSETVPETIADPGFDTPIHQPINVPGPDITRIDPGFRPSVNQPVDIPAPEFTRTEPPFGYAVTQPLGSGSDVVSTGSGAIEIPHFISSLNTDIPSEPLGLASEPTSNSLNGEIPPHTTPGNYRIENGVIVELIPVPGVETIARVGTEVILFCDVESQAKRVLKDDMEERIRIHNIDWNTIPKTEKDAYINATMNMAYQNFLKNQIDAALIYNDFCAVQTRDNIEAIKKSIGEEFDRSVIKNMIKEYGLQTFAELKQYLHENYGTTIEREREHFVRQTLAGMWLQSQLPKPDSQCTYHEMKDYYEAHIEEYTTKGTADWEQMSVRISRGATPEDERNAYEKIRWMGNQVAVFGAPFSEIAKANSDGLTKDRGGLITETVEGSLSSKELDKAIFSLARGQLSPIIRDDTGFHIIRVIKRIDTSVKPFVDTQLEIKEKIRGERLQRSQDEYFTALRNKYPIEILKPTWEPQENSELSSRPDNVRGL